MSLLENFLLSESDNDLNDSSELDTNSLSSKKGGLITNSDSTFDSSDKDKNSNRTSSKITI